MNIRPFPINGGKVYINPMQVVSAERSKDGESYTIYMTDDKTFTLTKGDFNALKTEMERPLVVNVVLKVEQP